MARSRVRPCLIDRPASGRLAGDLARLLDLALDSGHGAQLAPLEPIEDLLLLHAQLVSHALGSSLSRPLAPESALVPQAVYVAVAPDTERTARGAPVPRIQVVGDRAPDDLGS